MNILNTNKKRENKVVKTTLEDIKEKIKIVDRKIVEIETEIVIETEIEIEEIEEIEETVDQDQMIETEEINVEETVGRDQDHNQETLLWKESSWLNNGTKITTKADWCNLFLFYVLTQLSDPNFWTFESFKTFNIFNRKFLKKKVINIK